MSKSLSSKGSPSCFRVVVGGWAVGGAGSDAREPCGPRGGAIAIAPLGCTFTDAMFPGSTRDFQGLPMSIASSPATTLTWRTPAVIVLCGCLAAVLTFGLRSSLGFFLTPISQENGWGRDVFAFAIALQNLLWGLGQPFAGAIADRFGTVRVLSAGAILYGLGLVVMAYSSTPGMLDLTAGVLLGFGLAGASFTIVIAAFGKLVPERWRSLSFGAGTAAGSFGQL